MPLRLVALAALVLSPAAMHVAPVPRWAGVWGYAPADAGDADPVLPPGTYRYHVTLSGSTPEAGAAMVATFANAEGRTPVTIASASIAAAAGPTTLDGGAARAITFGGAAGITLPPGRTAVGDAVTLPPGAGRDLVVRVAFATPTRPARTNLGWPMDFVVAGAAPQPVSARPYLSLVAVRRSAPPCTVVAFGDSITDGYGERSASVRGWPGRLAERLARRPAGERCGVVNAGVSGNRLLRDGRGVAGLDRFWRDVASVPGVTHVILLEGINDIGAGGDPATGGSADRPAVRAADLIGGYRQFVARAHALGIVVLGGTLTPAAHAGYMTPAKEAVRRQVNAAIRAGGLFDGVVDFDAAVRDPARPGDFRPQLDSGDHLHPSDAGLSLMGDAVDLDLLASPRRPAPAVLRSVRQ